MSTAVVRQAIRCVSSSIHSTTGEYSLSLFHNAKRLQRRLLFLFCFLAHKFQFLVCFYLTMPNAFNERCYCCCCWWCCCCFWHTSLSSWYVCISQCLYAYKDFFFFAQKSQLLVFLYLTVPNDYKGRFGTQVSTSGVSVSHNSKGLQRMVWHISLKSCLFLLWSHAHRHTNWHTNARNSDGILRTIKTSLKHFVRTKC